MKHSRLLVLGAGLFGVVWVGFNPEWLESVGIGREFGLLAIFFFAGFVDWAMQGFRPNPQSGDEVSRDAASKENATK